LSEIYFWTAAEAAKNEDLKDDETDKRLFQELPSNTGLSPNHHKDSSVPETSTLFVATSDARRGVFSGQAKRTGSPRRGGLDLLRAPQPR
jgi:hypothetical protein